MKVYTLGKDKIERDPEASVTIGTFDGVHRGHCQILDKILKSGHATLVTFKPHPQHVFREDPTGVPIITPLSEKVRKLELMGVERVVVIPFSKEFASIPAEQFLKNILIDTIGLKHLVIGFNHSFGKNREGNAEFLAKKSEEYGFQLSVVGAFTLNTTTISSTLIRKTIANGDVEKANEYLGNPFRLFGNVVHGDGRGRGLGYPTANLKLAEDHLLVPGEGVYTCAIYHEGRRYPGIASIGRCETFGEHPLAVEAHIFDETLNLYDKLIAVEFLEFIRPQVKFKSVEELLKQMQKDELHARQFHETYNGQTDQRPCY
ncbi:bifunctional riboflavin kinase/FAD synthetase [bacterium]|nr:bifunctional riboflavin kinase/FAD synthetase [bacterium]